MPRWQKLLRHDALIHSYKEAVRNAITYACPRLSGETAPVEREPAGMEPLEPRLLLSGSISGTVYADLDGDGVRDAGEDEIDLSVYDSNWGVYIDANNPGNNSFDTGETKVTPSVLDGSYSFTGLGAGTYDIRAHLPFGWSPTDPSDVSANAEYVINLGVDEDNENNDFGVAPFLSVSANAQTGPSDAVIEGAVPVQLSLTGFGFTIDTWSVDWGDGQSSGPLDKNTSSTLHTYDEGVDTYTATVSVVDELTQLTYVRQVDIRVNNAAPAISITGDSTSALGGVYQLDIDATDSGIVDTIVQWQVDWGDGSAIQYAPASGTSNSESITLTHQYTIAGNHTITVRAQDSDGDWTGVGDLDGDGLVGITDLNIVLGDWNQNVPPADPLADPSGDGYVGLEDLNVVLGNWNVSDTTYTKTVNVTDQGGVTYTVSTIDDELDASTDPLAYNPGDLSLREALALATNHVNASVTDTIVFDETVFGSIGTIELDHGELVIDRHVTIQGPGAGVLTIDGQGLSRVFKVEDIDATIEGLTITRGRSPGTSQGGSGIFSEGDLILQSVHIDKNQGSGLGVADVLGGFGTGIHQSGGTIQITDSTVSGQLGGVYGGGLYALNAESVTITNSTFSGNYAHLAGGGIYLLGDILDPTIATLTNLTITENNTGIITALMTFGAGGGLALGTGVTATINNSIIAANTNSIDPDTTDIAIAGTNPTANNNLIGFDPITSNGFVDGVNGNQVGGESSAPAIDPKLAPLGDYGGPTPTHALLTDSPAIDAGDNTSASGLTYDQRGDDYNREVAGTVDIGAFEHDVRLWIEAENTTTISGDLRVIGDLTASGNRLITVSEKLDLVNIPLPVDGFATYQFEAPVAGTYRIWGRTITPNSGADSFYVRIDPTSSTDPWTSWDNITHDSSWQWHEVHDSNNGGATVDYVLTAGTHTLEIAYQDDGAQLDKLLITNDLSLTPADVGGDDPEFTGIKTIDLLATVRDFHSGEPTDYTEVGIHKRHPDFELIYTLGEANSDLVFEQLGPDGKPVLDLANAEGYVYDARSGNPGTTEFFDLWYTDDPAYNRSLDVVLRLMMDPNNPGTYQFVGSTASNGAVTTTASTNEFFPIDNLLFAEDNLTAADGAESMYSDRNEEVLQRRTDEIQEDHNYHFTLELHAEFTYRAGQTFNVSQADDDLWIFIDGQRVVDLGGQHEAISYPEVDLDTLGLIDGETYSFDLFFAERRAVSSHLIFETNIDDLRTRIVDDNTAPYFTSDPYQGNTGQTRVIDTLVNNATAPHHLEIVADGKNELAYALTGLDPENDSITFSILQGPDVVDPNDMTIDTSSGAPVLSWKPAALAANSTVTHQVRLRVTDEHGLYSPNNDQLFQIKLVSPDNLPPQFDYDPVIDVDLATGLNDQAVAFDPDDLPEELVYSGHLVAPPTDASLNDALTGYWNFNNTLDDNGVFDNDATATGATLQSLLGINGALVFDGVNDYASAGSEIDPTKNSFTVATWVRLDRLPSSGNMVLIGQDGTNPANWLYVDSNGILKSDLGSSTAASTDALTPEAWHHVAMTYDLGAETLKLYVDGELVDTETSVTATTATGQIIFGKDADSAADYLDGALDDVRIYRFVRDDFDIYKLAKPYVAAPTPVVAVKDLQDFNGSSDSLTEGNQGIDPSQQSFSLSTRVRLDQWPTSGNMVLIGQDGTNPANWLYVDSNGILKSDLGGTATVESPDALRAGVWYHVALTYDHESDTLRLYINSDQQDVNTSVSAAATSGQFVIGKNASASNSYLDGSLRDLRIHTFVLDSSDIDVLTQSYKSKFSVSESGEIIWNPPADLSGQQVTLDMRVEDPAGLYDIYNYQLNIFGGLPDLAVDVVDPFTAIFDPQALTVSGTVKAKISNLGDVSVSDPFEVLFFEDIDFDQTYTAGVDNLLGTTYHNASLDAGKTAWVAADLDGDVQYAGAPIWAWVDSGETIAEIDETNNTLGSNYHCAILPGEFDIVQEHYITDSGGPLSSGVMTSPMVADIDKAPDNIPEIIAITLDGTLVIIDPLTQTIIDSIQPDYIDVISQIAVGQIDDDVELEIIVPGPGHTTAYDYDSINGLVEKWETVTNFPGSRGGAVSLVDFDHNGEVEVVIGTTVLRGSDGLLLADPADFALNENVYEFGSNFEWGPISSVADLDLDGTPEIIAGNSALHFDGQNYSLMWHQTSQFGSGSDIYTIDDGFTAIGNFDEDHYPEIALVSFGRLSVLEHDGQVKYDPIVLPGGGYGGAPTIGNFDGLDGLEIGVAGTGGYTVFNVVNDQLAELWTKPSQDVSSNVTGASLFDFNSDGKVEVVYSDEVNLWIRDGATGDLLTPAPIPVGTNTATELPVIADVDADGDAEIILSTNSEENHGPNDGIMIFGGPNGSWASTRQIWNQHSYHITNVNDDGTIPLHEDRSWLTHNTYRLNTFTDHTVNPLAAPDLVPSYLRIAEVSGDTTYTIRVGNGGSASARTGVNVSFYNTSSGAPVLLGVGETSKSLIPGDYDDVSITITAAALSMNDILVVVDDDGTGIGAIDECNELNNHYPIRPGAEVTSTPDRYGQAGVSYSYQVNASAVLNDPITLDPTEKRTFVLTKQPVGTETSMTIDPDSGLISWTPGDLDHGNYVVEVMVRYTDIADSNKLTRFAVQSYDLRISKRDNALPIIVETRNENLATDGTYTVTIEASDADGDTLAFSAEPARGSIDFALQPDGVTAIMTWTPDAGETGGFLVSVEVADGFGEPAIVDIKVPAINLKPVFITEDLDTAIAGKPYSFLLTAVDPEDTEVTYSQDGGQWTNINLDPAGVITTDAALAAGSYTFTVKATDADLNAASREYTLIVSSDTSSNASPTIDAVPRSKVGVRQWFVYRVETSDLDGDHVSVIDATITPAGGGSALSAAVWDPNFRTLHFAPRTVEIGSYNVNITISDGRNPDVTETYSLDVVAQSSGSPPEIVDKDYPSAIVGQPYRIQFEATDQDNDPVWWEITDAPDEFMQIDSITGEFVWTPLDGQRPSQDVYVRAVDATGMSSTVKLTIPVRSANSAPRILSITPVPGEGFKFLVKAEDIDGDDLTITIGPDSDHQVGDPGVTFEQIDGTTAALTVDSPSTGDHLLQFEVADGEGLTNLAQLTVNVSGGSVGGSNSPTAIMPDPGYFAMPGIEYVYSFNVADDDDPSSANTVVTLPTKPTGMQIEQNFHDPSLWTITWTPTAGQGGTGTPLFHDVVIEIDDGAGAVTSYGYEIGVRDNNRPTMEAGRTIDVYSGASFTYQLRVQDQDMDLILFELKQADGSPIPDSWGLSIDEYGEITWDNADVNRTFVVRAADTFPASAEDPNGSWVESTFTLNVISDQIAPTVTITPYGTVAPGSVIHLQLDPIDTGSGVADVTLDVTYNSQTTSITVDPGFVATYEIPDSAVDMDKFDFTATVWDNVGNSSTGELELVIDSDIPVVELNTPVADADTGLINISAPTKLIGTISDNNLDYYKVEMISLTDGSVTTIKEVNQPSSNITNSEITVLDPTSLADGSYLLSITATDTGNKSITKKYPVLIDSTIKVGNFNLSFTDLSIPVAGQNIRIVRNYDTLLAGTKGDFGYGWTAEILTGKLEVSGLADDGRNEALGLDTVLSFTSAYQQGTRVTLSLPNGREYGFTAVPTLQDEGGAGPLWQAGLAVLYFQPDLGQNAVLDLVGGSTSKFDIVQNGELIQDGYRSVDVIVDDATGQFRTSGFPVSPQNIGSSQFRLRDVDGSTYIFDIATGQLVSGTDPFKNQLIFGEDGDITVNDGESNPLSSVQIDRDTEGRITKVTAPDGSTLLYTYDPVTGDLTTFTNLEGETVTFNYGDINIPNLPEHYLTSIDQGGDTILEAVFKLDPNVSNAYLLDKIIDATGSSADFGYELDGDDIGLPDGYTAETVSDSSTTSSNNTSNTIVRDERGNTVRTIQNIYDDTGTSIDSYMITLFGYYDQNADESQRNPDLLTHQSEPFTLAAGGPANEQYTTGAPADLIWATISQFDQFGRLTHTINGVSNSDAFVAEDDPDERIWLRPWLRPTVTEYRDFDDFGNPETILTPGGGRTTNTYNQNGQLDSTIQVFFDINGAKRTNTTKYGYNNIGHLDQVTQVNDEGENIVVSSFKYDPAGRLIESTSNGLSSYFAYDLNGRQTHTWRVWQDDPTTPTVFKTFATATDYDLQGRVLGTAQFVFDIDVTVQPPNNDNGAAYIISNAPADRDLWTGVTPPDDLQSFSLTEYNSRGQVTKTTDQFGAVSYTYYDKRGLVVETASQAKEWNGSSYVDAWIVSRTAFDTLGRATHSLDPFVVLDTGNPDDYDERPTSQTGYGSVTVYDRHGRVAETHRVSDLQITNVAAGNYRESTASGGTTLVSKSETEYDDSGRVEASIDHNDPLTSSDNARTDYYYDNAGRQIGVLGPVVQIGTANVRSLTLTIYDAAGRQKSTITGYAVPSGATAVRVAPSMLFDQTTFEPDYMTLNGFPNNQLRTTELGYDALGRVDTTTQVGDPSDPLHPSEDVVSQTLFDSQGRRVGEIDPLGRRTNYQFDDSGQLTGVTLPQIDPHADATGSYDTRRPQYEYTYDIYGNQETITDPIGSSTSAANDRQTVFTYDHLGRQTSRTLPLGTATGVESMHYDDTPLMDVIGSLTSSVANGQLAYTVDFEGNVTAYKYDNSATGGGRLVSKTYYDAAQVTGTITVGESPTSIEAKLGTDLRTIDYTYDAFGRNIDTIDSVHGTTTNTYDIRGRLTQIASPVGYINYQYSDRGELERTWTSKSDTNTTDAITDTRYGYDNLGRLTSVEMVERNDAPVTGEEVTYAYDINGAQDYEHNEATGVTKDVVYDDLGRAVELHHFQDANADGDRDSGDKTIAKFIYEYDAAGNRITSTEYFSEAGTDDSAGAGTFDQAQKFTWKYDGLNRLVVETFDSGEGSETLGTDTTNDYVTRYTFDLASNRTLMQKDTGTHDNSSFSADETVTYTYDDNDRIVTEAKVDHATPANNTFTEYIYDNTTQTSKTVYSGTDNTGTVLETVTNAYDATGRMTQITVVKGGTTTVTDYAYNDAGLRISATVTVNGGTPVVTLYHFDTNSHTGYAQVLEEGVDTNTDGRLQFGEVAATGGKTFTLGHDVIAQMAAGELLALLYDIHGSTRALVDTSGVFAVNDNGTPGNTADDIIQAFTYDAYGNMVDTGFGAATQATAMTRLLYSGEFTNVATGQQYLRARFYDPATGRFNRLDPYVGDTSDPLSLHKYLYTHGNPVMGLDPSGLLQILDVNITISVQTVLVASLIGGGIGGAAAIGANFALDRPLTQGLGFGVGFGAVALPLALAFPPLGIAIAGWSLFNASNVLYATWANPNSSIAQKGVATLLFAAAGTGVWGSVRYQGTVNGWYNPRVVNATRAAPRNPLTNQTILAEHFTQISDNTFVHVTPSRPASFNSGVRPKTFFFRWGDIKHLTPAQLRALVGDLAPGGNANAGNYIFVEPSTVPAGAFKPVGPPVLGTYQQYLTSQQVQPTYVGSVRSSGSGD